MIPSKVLIFNENLEYLGEHSKEEELRGIEVDLLNNQIHISLSDNILSEYFKDFDFLNFKSLILEIVKINEKGVLLYWHNGAADFIIPKIICVGPYIDIGKYNHQERLLYFYYYNFTQRISLLQKQDSDFKILINAIYLPAIYSGVNTYIQKIFNTKRNKNIYIYCSKEYFQKFLNYSDIIHLEELGEEFFDLIFFPTVNINLSTHIIKSLYYTNNIIGNYLDDIGFCDLSANYSLSYIYPNSLTNYNYLKLLNKINLITISNYVKNSSFKYLDKINREIKVLYLGTGSKNNFEIQLNPIKKIFINGDSSPRKRVDLTVATIYQFIKTNNIKCYTACETAIKDSLIVNLQSNLTEQHQIDSILVEVDLVIYPSVNEGFGLPIFEALEAGKPIILYDNDLNRELYENLINGKDKDRCLYFYKTLEDINLILNDLLNIDTQFLNLTTSQTWEYIRQNYLNYLKNIDNKKLDEATRSEILLKNTNVINTDNIFKNYKNEITLMKKWIEKQERDIKEQRQWIENLEGNLSMISIIKIKKYLTKVFNKLIFK